MSDENWKTEFDNMCYALNMDCDAKKDALAKFEDVQGKYPLEAPNVHWLACALYDSCFSRQLVTVGGERQQGNYLSLTQLLKAVNLKFYEFLEKLDIWQLMAKLSEDFRVHVDKLRRRWVVTSHIFKKYKTILTSILKPIEETAEFRPKRKARREVSNSELYRFVWTFYCYIKSNFPQSVDDTVSSSQLLLAVSDYCFAELYYSKKELLSEDAQNAFRQSDNPPSILEHLCDDYGKLNIVETKRIQEYHMKPYINTLFKDGKLSGNDKNTGIFDFQCFESNVKSINKSYDTFILKQGEYDNRNFLEPISNPEHKTPKKTSTICRTPSDASVKVKRNLLQSLEQSIIPQTPLSNRNYLPEVDDIQRTPISQQAEAVNRLNHLIKNYHKYPSPVLDKLLKRSHHNLRGSIGEIEQELRTKFKVAYCNGENNAMDFAKQRLAQGVKLFYRILECVVIREEKRSSQIGIRNILSSRDFIAAMFSMSIEIVLFTYGSNERKFPWILESLGIHSFHAWKVIETIVMNDVGLSRSIVKHLNTIEETMLETMVWRVDSPLYTTLSECSQSARPPKYEDVMPRGGSQTPNPYALRQSEGPNTEQGIQRFATLNPSIPNRKSWLPRPLGTGGSPFEKLEKVDNSYPIPVIKMVVPSLIPVNHDPHPARDGAQTPVSALATDINMISVMSPPPRPVIPKSVQLFFRKVYNLTYLRMRNLTEKLQIPDEIVRQIWTVFEHSVTSHLHLFVNRHIDQLIICSTYLIIKAAAINRINFRKIIECYRDQPQAGQHIYRNVLITPQNIPENLRCTCLNTQENPNLSGAQERGDIIKFYNNVYITHIGSFIDTEVSGGQVNLIAPLSPMPTIHSLTQSPLESFSPRKIPSHNINVSPHKSNGTKLYIFGQSPTKNIEEMNTQIKNKPKAQKRALIWDDSGSVIEKVSTTLHYDD